MSIKKIYLNFTRIICLAIYYGFARYLPNSYSAIGGRLSMLFRRILCKQIFKYCGQNINIERMANFGSGRNICIGNNSGIGINACIPSDTIIGNDVMMGPNCYILSQNHIFERTDIPMNQQGETKPMQTIIGNDVWIGRDVLIMPGRIIKEGTIIGGGTVLTKNFDAYSIVGGNPSKLIRMRK